MHKQVARAICIKNIPYQWTCISLEVETCEANGINGI
jgi:hypothetical protein